MISINIPFWYTSEERLDNLRICYKVVKQLQKYLISNGVYVKVNVFEFSEEQKFDSSVFIPIGKQYNKSYKLNHALKWLNQNQKPDICCFIDSDCFVDRIDYYQKHLNAVHNAIEQGVNVKGYFAWSLMDNFEWAEGYLKRFGIVYVDYESQVRTIKNSGLAYKSLISNR